METTHKLIDILPLLDSVTENIEFFELISGSQLVVLKESRDHLLHPELDASVLANEYFKILQSLHQNRIEQVVFVPSVPRADATKEEIDGGLARINDVQQQLNQSLQQAQIQLKLNFLPTW